MTDGPGGKTRTGGGLSQKETEPCYQAAGVASHDGPGTGKKGKERLKSREKGK